MSKKNESIQNEVIRMLQLSEFRNKIINKPAPVSKSEKKILKEEDFVEDLEQAFVEDDYFPDDLKTNSGNESALTNEMKTAMLAHSLSEFQTVALELYKNYNPKDYTKYTSPAKQGDNDAMYNKVKDLKIKGSIPNDDLKKLKDTEYSKHLKPRIGTDGEELEKTFIRGEKNIKDTDRIRVPITFTDNEEEIKKTIAKKSGGLQKWWQKKDMNMISYDSKSRTLTDLGKEQIEFLARAYTEKPLGEFETKLFTIFGNSKETNYHFRNTAEFILKQFYTHVCGPYIAELTHRAKYNPNDQQLKMFVENALDQVFDAMLTAFNPERGNVGSFVITSVKNNVINQLRNIADYKLDTTAVENILYSHDGPIIIKSLANPNEVEGNYDDVKEMPRSNSDGKSLYGYVYNNPTLALSDFTKDARKDGGKPSPLSRRFLTGSELAKFYKAFPPGTFEDVAQGLNYIEDNPYEKYSIFKIETLPQEAKATIYEILNQIADVMIDDIGKTNKPVRDSRGKIDYDEEGNFKTKKANLSYDDHNPDFSYVNKNIMPLLKRNKMIFIELMYELLGFGSMVNVYAKSWQISNGKNGSTWRSVGSPIVYDDVNGEKIPKPNIKGQPLPSDYIQQIWSAGSTSESEVKQKFLEKFLAKMGEKQGENTPDRELLSIFQQDTTTANAIISSVMNGLKKFFGIEGLNVPVLRKNRNKLNAIIQNYENSLLAENKARLIIKNLLNKTIKGNI